MIPVTLSSLPAIREQVVQQFEEVLKKVPENHYFPKAVMRKLLDKYSSEDLQQIYSDYSYLRQKAFQDAEKTREYVVTAGAPAAGKSTLLEKMIGFDPTTGTNCQKYVYIDPDRAVMQQMPAYIQDKVNMATGKGGRDAKSAYDHWREASNFIAQVLLVEALVDGYKIAHGNTMSVPQSITNLQAIQNQYHYTTRLIHCTTSDAIRMEREEMRQVGGIVQVTAEDFAQKSVMFFSLLPRYVEVSSVDFYYSKDALSTEHAASKELRKETHIVRPELFKEIIRIHKEKGLVDPESCFTS